MSSILRIMLALLLVAWGCNQSDFSGKAPQDGRDSDDATGARTDDGNDGPGLGDDDEGAGDDDGGGGRDGDESLGRVADGTDSDAANDGGEDDELELDEDETIHKPQACTQTNGVFAPSTAATCPEHFAAYTVDDGSSPHFGCCPLPAKDILSKDPAQARPGGTCQANEVITGVAGGGVMCTRINTDRYSLGQPQKTCYHGSGAAGGDGSQACGAPPATLQNLVTRFGSDACLGFPFGSLIVSRTGKNCRDASAAQLLYKDTGQPVKMYE